MGAPRQEQGSNKEECIEEGLGDQEGHMVGHMGGLRWDTQGGLVVPSGGLAVPSGALQGDTRGDLEVPLGGRRVGWLEEVLGGPLGDRRVEWVEEEGLGAGGGEASI